MKYRKNSHFFYRQINYQSELKRIFHVNPHKNIDIYLNKQPKKTITSLVIENCMIEKG